MKRGLIIYIDDDDPGIELMNATFVSTNRKTTTMLNEVIPSDAKGIYLPHRDTHGRTLWIYDDESQEGPT